ncbi:MAG: YciI family protein [Oryzihumus sp.]
MAEYLILIYDNESATTPEDWNRLMAGHQQFATDHGAALRGGNALQPSSTATSVRPDGAGGFTVTDAPFAETKEALGGYYVVEAADLEEAMAIARDVPTVAGGVEVRPIMTFN